MTKISFIGAGSTVFAKNLMGDILSFPELADATISLHDINEERLRTSEIVARKVAYTVDASPTIEATTDRRRSLDGADYAICMIQVAGYKPGTEVDFEVPKKYGLRQTIADTLGIGGIMRGLRTIPVRCDLSAICEPHGHELLGYRSGHVDQHGRSLPQRAGDGYATGPGYRRALRRDQLRLRRHQSYGFLSGLRAPQRRKPGRSLSAHSQRAG
jgi:hypothetical protein